MNDTQGEVIQTIKRKKYEIEFVKQENLEKNLNGLYSTITKLLYNQS